MFWCDCAVLKDINNEKIIVRIANTYIPAWQQLLFSMKIFKHLICSVIFLISTGAQALENQIALAGLGNMPCGDFIANQSSELYRDGVATWLQGFMTGGNILRTQLKMRLINIPDRDVLLYTLSNKCREDLNEKIFMSATKMVHLFVN
jgi:hypothetical protein